MYITSSAGRKFLTENGFSDINFLYDVEILADGRCFLTILVIFHCECAVSTILLLYFNSATHLPIKMRSFGRATPFSATFVIIMSANAQ